MKTNKILTEELSRIMEIMGVNSNTSSLITESIFDDIISGGIKLLGDTSDITKFTNKLSGEYGIPVNTPAVKRQIDEFVNINTSPIRKKEIFIDLIDEMDIDGIFKISDDLFKTNKIQSIIEDQVDAIKTAIQSGNFTLPSGKLDEISINRYIDEFTNSQIKTTNPSLRRVTDRLKTQIDDKISVEIRGTKVGKKSDKSVEFRKLDKTGDVLLNDVLNKLQRSESWNKLNPRLKRKITDKLKLNAEKYPDSNANELALIFDEMAYSKLKGTWVKQLRDKIKTLPDWLQYTIYTAMAIAITGMAGGVKELWPETVAFLKEIAQVLQGGWDEFDWSEIKNAYDEDLGMALPSKDEFKNFIIKSWGGDIRGDETYNQNGDLYIVNDGIDDYTYKYENGKFIYQKEY